MFGDMIRNILPTHSGFTLEECNKCEAKHEEKVPVRIKEQGEKVSVSFGERLFFILLIEFKLMANQNQEKEIIEIPVDCEQVTDRG